MPSREIDDQMYVEKLPQPNTVIVPLYHHRNKISSFPTKKELSIKIAQVCSNLLINENLNFPHYSLLKKLKSEIKRRIKNILAIFE